MINSKERKGLIFFVSICFFYLCMTGCEGFYQISGTVYERNNSYNAPIDSVTVKVFVGTEWFIDQRISDSSGHFALKGLTTPFKSKYYIVFQKTGFKTDTLFKQGNRGKTFLSFDHSMTRDSL